MPIENEIGLDAMFEPDLRAGENERKSTGTVDCLDDLFDVFRQRLTFPDLRKHVIRLAQHYGPQILLVEDAASGTQLIQQFHRTQPPGVPRPLPRRPDSDKITRMSGQTGRIESGELLIPSEADWLADFKHELLGFPYSRHNDQVDALAQLLGWSTTALTMHHGLAGPRLHD